MASTCDAHIQMTQAHPIQEPGITSGFIHPLLMGFQHQKPTLQNKYQGGWVTFQKAWKQYMAMVIACNRGHPIPDALLLQHLKTSLDYSDQLLLENHQEKDPGLTFSAFWAHLVGLYDKDTQAQLRLAWESVKLPPGELTLEKWNVFLREFQLKRDRVEEKTPQEEYTCS